MNLTTMVPGRSDRCATVVLAFRRLGTGVAAALLAAVTATATAMPILVTEGTATYVAANTTLNLAFDINPATSALRLTAPLNITSGYMTFYFADDSDPFNVVTRTTRSMSYMLCGTGFGTVLCQSLPHYVDHTTRSSVNPVETARVTSGGTSATASSSLTYQDRWYSYPVRSTETSCGYFGCTTTEMTVSVTSCGALGCGTTVYPLYGSGETVAYIYDGPFSLTMALDAAALADLEVDGRLPFAIDAASGDFNFLSASLSIDIDDQPTDDQPAGTVPEPTSAWLVAAGLAAAFGVCRRPLWRARGYGGGRPALAQGPSVLSRAFGGPYLIGKDGGVVARARRRNRTRIERAVH